MPLRKPDAQPSPARRRSGALAGMLLLVAAHAAGAAAQDRQPPALSVSVRGGLLYLDSRGAPLGKVLTAIAEQVGFDLALRRELDTPVTGSFSGVPVDEALARLLGNASSIALYRPTPDGRGRVLESVRVLRGEAVVAGKPMLLEPGTAQVPDPRPAAIVAEEVAEAAQARRRDVVRGLATGQPETAVPHLARTLRRDDDPAIRRIAARGLAEQGGWRAQNALRSALADEDIYVRQRAVQGLARRGGESAGRHLSRVLSEDKDAKVRRMAATSLGRLGDERAYLALVVARSDPDPTVREAASAALTRLKRRGVGHGD